MVWIFDHQYKVRILLSCIEEKIDRSAPFAAAFALLLLVLGWPIAALGCADTGAVEGCLNDSSAEESFRTAVAYSMGEGGIQDSVLAVRWMRRAATQGHRYAQFNLGEAYMSGYGVKQDYSAGINWLQRAANGGLADAQVSLGLKYDEGVGVTQERAMAVKWFRAAARQGNRDAQNNLGIAYAKGEGVTKDDVQAYRWFELARLAGHPSSSAYRDRIAKEMNAAQILEAQRQVSNWQFGINSEN